MIIYVSINKDTGEIIVNNDIQPDTDMVVLNPNTIENSNNVIKFEIAFNTSSFEKYFSKELNANTN
jgi:hypothetical protein